MLSLVISFTQSISLSNNSLTPAWNLVPAGVHPEVDLYRLDRCILVQGSDPPAQSAKPRTDTIRIGLSALSRICSSRISR